MMKNNLLSIILCVALAFIALFIVRRTIYAVNQPIAIDPKLQEQINATAKSLEDPDHRGFSNAQKGVAGDTSSNEGSRFTQ